LKSKTTTTTTTTTRRAQSAADDAQVEVRREFLSVLAQNFSLSLFFSLSRACARLSTTRSPCREARAPREGEREEERESF
jgi:hypothetical protein